MVFSLLYLYLTNPCIRLSTGIPEVLVSVVGDSPFYSLCLVTVCLLICLSLSLTRSLSLRHSPCLADCLGPEPCRCVLETSIRACPLRPMPHSHSSASSSSGCFLHACYDFPSTLVIGLGLLRLLASLTRSYCHFLIFLICIFISIGSIIWS